MKKYLTSLLLLMPFFLMAQDSWFKLEVQFDAYADDESFALLTQNGDTLVNYQPNNPFELWSTIIEADSGDIDISLLDDWGDGWQGGPQNQNSNTTAWLKISNECQGTILDLDVAGLGTFTQYDTSFTLDPCAPPVCNIQNETTYQICLSNEQILVVWEWENEWCDPVNVVYGNDEGWGPFTQGLNPGATNYGMLAGNGQMPPNWSSEHYAYIEYADGSVSDTMLYTPIPCIEGCIDSTQEAYNPWANEDDGSCSVTTCDPATEYQIRMEITLDNWPSETSWIMTTNTPAGNVSVPVGEYDGFDFGQTYTYDFCVSQTAGFELVVNDTYGDGMGGNNPSNAGSIVIYDCDGDTIWEMTNPNFGTTLYSGNQTATACTVVPDVLGCTDPTYQEYNPLANVDDGSCTTPHIFGCMDVNSTNYDSTATKQSIVPLCDYTLIIEDGGGDGWGNSWLGVAQDGVPVGVFTMGPGNYEQTFQFQLETDKTVEVYYFEVPAPQQSQAQVEFQTLQNSFTLENADSVVLLAWGQNPFSNNGAGALQPFEAPFFEKYVGEPYCGDSCIPIVLGCTDPTALNYNPDANTEDPNNPCIPYIEGCTNPLAFNYDPNATVDDGSCVPFVYGCMDPNSFNYDPNANVNQVSETDLSNPCIPIVYGCTDSTSVNYDPNANVDNGSCITSVVGCTDVAAYNYDPNANVSDSTACLYDAGCITGPGNPYWLNNPCYAWVIDVDTYCCDTEWDSDCQELYNYCEDGYPLDISELGGSKIAVYPNPTNDKITINTSLRDVNYMLFDLTGRLLQSGEGVKREEVDISNYPNAVYLLRIQYDGNIYNKKIIKEDR